MKYQLAVLIFFATTEVQADVAVPGPSFLETDPEPPKRPPAPPKNWKPLTPFAALLLIGGFLWYRKNQTKQPE